MKATERKNLDEIDRKILRHLIADAEAPLSEIGARVGLSTTALHHRIKRLKKGIIQRFTIAISREYYSDQMSCFVKIMKGRKSSIDLASRLRAMSEVEACYSVAGEESLLLKVRTRSTHELQSLLEAINKLEGIERTVTSLIIEEHFDKGSVVL